jgi:release factor glutamine methyltransferase
MSSSSRPIRSGCATSKRSRSAAASIAGLAGSAIGDLGRMRLVSVPGVFQPLSDSWMLADALRAHAPAPGAAVLDLCTGSGMLAVQAALLGARATAVDVLRRALLSARLNALLNGVRVQTLHGWLFSGLEGERFDTIVSNPPYVPSRSDALPARGPRRAWDAGRDGRALLDPLCQEVARHLRPGGSVLIVHSSVCGIERTLEELTRQGLDADVVASRRGPLGPLLRERAADLWATGALPPGSLEEEVVVVRGRRPAVEAA